jgi:hypothetical protein
MSIKISALPTVTSVDNSDVFPVNAAGVTSKIALSSLKTVLNFQPLHANLTALAGASAPTSMGLGFLSSTTPTVASYALLGPANTVSYQTALQVVAYLRANGLGVDTTTAQLLVNKIINGLTVAVGTASTPDDIITAIDTPSDTYLLRLIKVNHSGGTQTFRFTGTTDVTFPKAGVLATVNRVEPTSDASQASAATLNLDSADGKQVDVTGTTGITAVTLAENSARIVRFTGITTLTAGASLLLPGDVPTITTGAGDFATFVGGAAGVVTVKDYHKAIGSTVADINGGSIRGLYRFGIKAGGNPYDLLFERNGTALTAERAFSIETADADTVLSIKANFYTAGTAAIKIFTGTGSPEAVVTANIGALYTDIAGSTSTTLYVKTAGNGLNTGWTAK